MERADYLRASNQFVGKIANKFRSDIVNIPFTYRINLALIMHKVPDCVPNDTQAKDLKHHITRAMLHRTNLFEGMCRFCQWCQLVGSWIRRVWAGYAPLFGFRDSS